MVNGNVTVESDSLLSVHVVNQRQHNLLEVGDLLQQCGDLLRCNCNLSLSHVKKQANKIAHSLARFPCELDGFIVFVSSIYIVGDSLVGCFGGLNKLLSIKKNCN